MPRRAGGRDFAPLVRSALARAIENKEDLEQILSDALDEDPVGTLQRLACYAPKQVDITSDNKTTVVLDASQLTPELLSQAFRERRSREDPQAADSVH